VLLALGGDDSPSHAAHGGADERPRPAAGDPADDRPEAGAPADLSRRLLALALAFHVAYSVAT
jgi:hypothetical protein